MMRARTGSPAVGVMVGLGGDLFLWRREMSRMRCLGVVLALVLLLGGCGPAREPVESVMVDPVEL